jgi:adiponectin receptor
LKARYTSVSTADTVVLGCFVLGAVLCLAISAIFHTVQNHSPHVARIANQMDYIGIVFLMLEVLFRVSSIGFTANLFYKRSI